MQRAVINPAFTIQLKRYANPYSRSNRVEGQRYVVEHVPGMSISVEELHASYKAIERELQRVGRLHNHAAACKAWKEKHPDKYEIYKQRKKEWNKNNRERENATARRSRQKQKEKRMVIEGKLRLLSADRV